MRTLRFYPENEDNGRAYYKRPNEDWLPLFTKLLEGVFLETELPALPILGNSGGAKVGPGPHI